jgi:transposase
MRKVERSRMNSTVGSNLAGDKSENHRKEFDQSKGNGENPSKPIRSSGSINLSPPDPEVREKPERRRFTASYKERIVREADACTEKGQIGALLRREGLYSSQLTEWRKQYRQGALAALKDDKRGRPKVNPLQEENEKLQRRVERLEHRLQQAETIIEAQKKIAAILGNPPASRESDEDA